MIQLIRQKSFTYGLSKPLSQRRGFYFQLQVGFSKELNPLSGMTVNLTEVDHWLQQFVDEISLAEKPEFDFQDSVFQGYQQAYGHGRFILQRAIDFFKIQSALVGAELVQVKLQEERNWSLSWNGDESQGRYIFTSSHYLENFAGARAELLRVSLSWSQNPGDSFDLARESLNLLKALSAKDLQGIHAAGGFKSLLGRELSPGTCVVAVDVENLSQSYRLSY